jgi:hypothetical protein
MSKKETFLELHDRLCGHGLVDNYGTNEGGLCGQPFRGTSFDKNETFAEYFPPINHSWWAYDDNPVQIGVLEPKIRKEYTPLRQNIILLCAAINGEL